MVTYLELDTEPVWGQQNTPPNMLELLVKPLRTFYNMGAALIGAPGDNRHLKGRHRSRDWDLTSIYCTNRTYATTDARDKDGHGSWYRAIDVGITSQTLYAASKRMDELVRSGADGGRVAEWFGTFDGRTVVGWFQGHTATSDESHLSHHHVGVWTRYANDPDLMQLLYATITGEDAMGLEEWTATPNTAKPWALTQGTAGYAGQQRDTALAFTYQFSDEANKKADKALAGLSALTGKVDQILALLQAGGGQPPSGPVDVTDEAAAKIADAVVDEQHDRLAE